MWRTVLPATSLLSTMSKYYCFTYFNIHNEQPEDLLKGRFDYLVYQLEKAPETGNCHYQGYVCLKKIMKLQTLANLLLKAHVEPRKGNHAEAKKYCMKDETRLAGPFEFGSDAEIPQGKGERTDLKQIYELVQTGANYKDIVESFPSEFIKFHAGIEKVKRILDEDNARKKLAISMTDVKLRKWQQEVLDKLLKQNDRHVLWVYDPKGNNGKTFLAKYILSNYNAFYVNNAKSSDVAYAYANQEYVLFDFTRDYENYINYGNMESFKNGLIFSSKYQSCQRTFDYCKVVVFANFQPNLDKLSADRWDLYEL